MFYICRPSNQSCLLCFCFVLFLFLFLFFFCCCCCCCCCFIYVFFLFVLFCFVLFLGVFLIIIWQNLKPFLDFSCSMIQFFRLTLWAKINKFCLREKFVKQKLKENSSSQPKFGSKFVHKSSKLRPYIDKEEKRIFGLIFGKGWVHPPPQWNSGRHMKKYHQVCHPPPQWNSGRHMKKYQSVWIQWPIMYMVNTKHNTHSLLIL